MQNYDQNQASVNLWLDLRTNVEELLHYATPEKHLEILETIYEAYIHSEWANDIEARREASIEYGIYRDLLKTLQRHTITAPALLPQIPA